jgi:hypothetical protein
MINNDVYQKLTEVVQNSDYPGGDHLVLCFLFGLA